MKNEAPAPPTAPNQAKRNLLPFGALGLSVLIHGGILLMVGGAVLVQGIIPKQSFEDLGTATALDEAMVLPEAPPEEVSDQPQVEQLSDLSQTASPTGDATEVSADIIIANSANGSMNLMPVMSNSVSPLSNRLGSGTGNKGAASSGPPGTKMVTLFGNPMESAKLGVILDVSGSTHRLLLPVMEEIDKKYGNALTVLAMGCGMSPTAAQKSGPITVNLYKDAKPDPVKDKPGLRTTLSQIAQATSKNDELAKYMKKLERRNDVWYVYGGDIFATRSAFEKMISEDVDTIFWFADFADSVAVAEAEELIKKLKSKRIKVILFNFTGKPTHDNPSMLGNKTGGKVISQIIQ